MSSLGEAYHLRGWLSLRSWMVYELCCEREGVPGIVQAFLLLDNVRIALLLRFGEVVDG